MTPMTLSLPSVVELNDPQLAAALRHKIERKTVPHGALGRLAALAERLGLILGTTEPRLLAPQLVVCAADHGIAARGVSAYPSDVTWQMVGNFLAGGAAVSVLARQHGIAQTVVDCGVRKDFAPAPGLVIRKIASGTQDSSVGPAMSAAQCEQAVQNGIELVRGLPGNALLLGEMGIANSSAAALLMARLTGEPLSVCTGRGTGLDDVGLAHKREVLQRALSANAGAVEPLAVLAALGGLEIATMVGAIQQAAADGRVIVVDGFITTAAAAVAAALRPGLLAHCVFSHRSQELGHARWLQQLGVQPLLDLDLRLGEGSGAALGWPLLESACRVLAEMASFESAGVSGRAESL